MKRMLVLSTLILVALLSVSAYADLCSYASSVLWRQANDVAVGGNYAYCAAQSGLMVINIVNRSAPQWVSQYYTQGTPTRIAVSGFFVYMTCSEEGLYILANTDPENIQLVLQLNTPGNAQDVFVSGNYAYVADGSSGLEIFDVSTPINARMISSYSSITNAKNVYVSNNYAYVADDYGHLHIINVSDPEHPTETLNYTVPRYCEKVSVSGNYAYIATGYMPMGLYILDVTNPASPTLACSLSTGGFAVDVAVSGNYVYMDDGNVLTIINATNRTNPFVVSALNIGGWAGGMFTDGVYYVYLANTTGLNICQIDNPMVPINIGNYEMPNYASVFDVDVVGTKAYISNGDEGLWIYDVTSADDPQVEINFNLSSAIRGLKVIDSLAYISAEDSPKLHIMNVSIPFNATVLGTFDTAGSAYNVDVVGNYAYIAGASPGLQIVDISDPTMPVSVGSYEIATAVKDVKVVGNYAYVAAYGNGLYILNISQPSAPTLVSNFDTERAVGVAVDGIFVYIADSYDGLRILSAFNPANPVEIVHNTDIETVNDVFIYGQYLLVGAAEEGVWVYDISNPAAPEFIETFETPGHVLAVKAAEGRIYVSDMYSMTILEFAASSIDENRQNMPRSYLAGYGYPNPFNASTTISYEIGKRSNVSVTVYDILGQKVETLFSGNVETGRHSIDWKPKDLGTGIYFCKIQADDSQSIQKLTLLK